MPVHMVSRLISPYTRRCKVRWDLQISDTMSQAILSIKPGCLQLACGTA